jgi:diguanylate cyclase (GGDEF)-like protein
MVHEALTIHSLRRKVDPCSPRRNVTFGSPSCDTWAVQHFKALNDRFGHATGDVVLRAIGRTIATTVRDLDVPVRFGGEEFVVVLRNPTREVALEVGERIRAAVERIDLRDVGVDTITVSVGASVSRADGETVATLVDRADHAMYRAKRYGRNRVETA